MGWVSGDVIWCFEVNERGRDVLHKPGVFLEDRTNRVFGVKWVLERNDCCLRRKEHEVYFVLPIGGAGERIGLGRLGWRMLMFGYASQNFMLC